MKNRKVIVLGAGIAGISATYHALAKGFEVMCYEKSDVVGGLIANFEIHGFRFDNAVHLSFTKNEMVKSLFAQTEFLSHRPNAYCLENGKWLKHPVQNNLYPLEIEEKVALIKSFTQRPSLEPSNYAEWLVHQYGNGIADRYPKKYTEKYWGCDASELTTTWIGNRMRRAEIDEILRGALVQGDANHYYANEMRYPKKGGYFEFIRGIAGQCPISTNKEVIEIDVDKKRIFFSDGSNDTYDELVSSLPLPILLPMLSPRAPQEVMEAVRRLLWTTVDLVSVGFDRPDIPPCLWYYIYDDDNVAARAYSPSLKSPENAPEGKSSLQFEIYNLSTKDRLKPQELMNNIRTKLIENAICNEEEILFCHHKHLPFGNVVFNHGMKERRQLVTEYIKGLGVKSCGRFGEWDYLWSDQSYCSAKETIDGL